jgi:hypothetical protein
VDDVRDFFACSDVLDYLVLKPLSHITLNWEAQWDLVTHRYKPEAKSFADDLNAVIDLIAASSPPTWYHDHEVRLAERVIRELGWPIQKKGSRWVGSDYASIVEQGAFRDLKQRDLVSAASGRVHAAFMHGQRHIGDMENCHQAMLTALLTIIIYHRYCDGTCLFTEAQDEVP